jgi:hypothetical protein
MRQRILSHRGCWMQGHPKNSAEALRRSFQNGYGIETDIRDYCGEIVISHDIPTAHCLSLAEVLTCAPRNVNKKPITVALNVKSDGLAHLVKREISHHPDLDCFVFDMSVPDMREYLKLGINCFTRMSEVEQNPVWIDCCNGIWLDSFDVEWYSTERISLLLLKGKQICVVSPELHGRPHLGLWTELRKIWKSPGLMLCTDFPDDAVVFFSEATF